MKKLRIEKNKYGLRIFCVKCQRLYYHDSIRKCNHPESQRYKSVVYTVNGTKVKHYPTRDFDEALGLAIAFKKEVKLGISSNSLKMNDKSKSLSIRDAANDFYDFKCDLDVPSDIPTDCVHRG